MQLKQKKKLIILLLIMCVFSIISLFSTALNSQISNVLSSKLSLISNNDALIVHFVNVGQGDAIAINLPNGKTMLIDAGPVDANTTLTNYLQTNVLHTKRKNYIDYFIITHPDLDHFGGALRVLQNFNIGTIFLPDYENESNNGYTKMLEFVKTAKIPQKTIENNENLSQNGVDIKFFVSSQPTQSSNESCPVIKISYLNKSFLFTGDIDEDIEKSLVNEVGSELDCDVLKVAHHGSKNSSCLEFLSVATPEYAVISCGVNGYGHPTDTAINNLKTVNANIFRTDIQGNIMFALSKNYHLLNICGTYTITPLAIEIRYLILLVDVGISAAVVVLLVKNNKDTKKSRKNA